MTRDASIRRCHRMTRAASARRCHQMTRDASARRMKSAKYSLSITGGHDKVQGVESGCFQPQCGPHSWVINKRVAVSLLLLNNQQ